MEDIKQLKIALILIVVGIWFIVFQNFGIFPRFTPVKIESDAVLTITGTVDIENTVFVKGQVDVNIESINVYSKFYKDPRTGQYYVLPVTDPYEE